MTFGGSGLIKGMAFGWRDFIRMSFGGRGLMKRSAFKGTSQQRSLLFIRPDFRCTEIVNYE
jgi:hypothetical protein